MQEEVTQKTIALVIKTAKLDANVLKAAMRMYLNHRRQKAQKTHGKTSVKKLVGEGVGVSSIEVTDGNIKSFERVARKYNVNFVVKKDKTNSICSSFKGLLPFAISRSMTLLISLIDSICNFLLPTSGHCVQKKKSSYKYFTHNCSDAVSLLFDSCSSYKLNFFIDELLLFFFW